VSLEHGSGRRVPPSAHFAGGSDGALACDGVSLETIAGEHGTPTHVVSAIAIERAYRDIASALRSTRPSLVCYAAKANGSPAILALLGGLGAGVDVVSGGELHWALRAGIAPEKIVFSGVGKTDAEIAAAIGAGIRAIHVESEPELRVIESIARARGARARIGLRINPDVDPVTHPYIATGIHHTKFGLELDVARALVPQIVQSASLELDTIASHIGSQIGSASALGESVAISAAFARECIAAGAPIRTIDAGGGWPIEYGDEDAPHAAWPEFGAAIDHALGDLPVGVSIEPGRALVGDAGALLTRVLYVKEQAGKRFVIVNAAMTELIRPALYGAYHAIVPVRARAGAATTADVVGPVCETGDFLALDRALPPIERGDLLLVRGTGAYGAAMASRYNARPLAAEILIESGSARVIRPRERVDDLYPAVTLGR
jgi:diaminopimelate decarboxylase